MSRAIDLLLLGALAFLGWKLVHTNLGGTAAGERAQSPISVSLKVRGDAPLDGLGVILSPADLPDRKSELTKELNARQLAPFDRDRMARVFVPRAGRYEVRWASQDQDSPQQIRDVMGDSQGPAGGRSQHIEVRGGVAQPIEIELDRAQAEALRRR